MQEVAQALTLSNGRVHTAADYLSCSANTVYGYIRENPELAELRQHLHERPGDIAESMLDEAVKAKEAWAICFQLKTQFKGRGYIERTERTGANGEPLNIDATEIKRERLTLAVQNGINQGWSLKDSLQYLAIRGISREDLSLVRGEDLYIPASPSKATTATSF